jgi:hypothetical protein
VLTERDRDILDHVALYRFTLREVLAHAFELANPGNVLQHLRETGLLSEPRRLTGRLSYYQLTAAGAAGRCPLDRTESFGETALKTHLAAIWFSYFSKQRRRRLEDFELLELFGDETRLPPQVAFCIDQQVPGVERRRIYRLYAPGSTTRPAKALHALRQVVLETRERGGKVADWMHKRLFAFAVLVDHTNRLEELRAALKSSPLLQEAHVELDLAPTPRRLPDFLHARRRRA